MRLCKAQDLFLAEENVECMRLPQSYLGRKDDIFVSKLFYKCARLPRHFSTVAERENDKLLANDSTHCVSLLRRCAGEKALWNGKIIHGFIIEDGLEGHVYVVDALLRMYSDCKASEDALILFHRLYVREAFAWTFIIRAYSHSEGLVLHFFQQMQIEGILPTKFTYIGSLSACTSLLAGAHLHLNILSIGLDSDVFVATALLTMYANCGSIKGARSIFETTSNRDTVTWNAMLAALVDARLNEDAFLIFKHMQKAGVAPSKATFLSVLEACANMTAHEEGKMVYRCIVARKMLSDVSVGNALINMYRKCGSIEDARKLFDEMPIRDTISWNTVIAAYAECEQGKEALTLFDQMQQENIKMDGVTFVSILSVCASLSAFILGKLVHTLMECTGFLFHVVVRTALINMYGKCGSLRDAQVIFDKMQERDTVTWNALIATYSHLGFWNGALLLYEKMHSDHVLPDTATFVTILYTCACHEDVEVGKHIHKHIKYYGLEDDLVVRVALIQMFSKLGCKDDAETIFSQISDKDVTLWNAMIVFYAQTGVENCAFTLYNLMLGNGVLPNKVSCSSIIDACASQLNLSVGKQMHARFAAADLDFDIVVGTSLVNMYGKCDNFDTARQIFDRLEARDLIAWTTMISLHAHRENALDAFSLLIQMQQEALIPDMVTFFGVLSACAIQDALSIGKQIHACVGEDVFDSDVVAGNVLINMYGKCGSLEDACTSFEQMDEWDSVTFLNIFSACASRSVLSKGYYVHSCLIISDLNLDPLTNALINMYGKCGCLKEAQALFNHVGEYNLVTWNTIIAAYAQHGNGGDVIQLYYEMQQVHIRPDTFTYVSVISACSHAGLIEEGLSFFLFMQQQYDILPLLDHYNCIVDMLARAGQLDEAEHLINKMPTQPTAVTWTTLLGACRSEIDVKRGERAALRALKLASEESAPYILLSNMYASTETGFAVGTCVA